MIAYTRARHTGHQARTHRAWDADTPGVGGSACLGVADVACADQARHQPGTDLVLEQRQ
jgi:hypothetical protein